MTSSPKIPIKTVVFLLTQIVSDLECRPSLALELSPRRVRRQQHRYKLWTANNHELANGITDEKSDAISNLTTAYVARTLADLVQHLHLLSDLLHMERSSPSDQNNDHDPHEIILTGDELHSALHTCFLLIVQSIDQLYDVADFQSRPASKVAIMMEPSNRLPYVVGEIGLDARKNTNGGHEEVASWTPQATPDGRLFYFNNLTGVSTMELPSESPHTINDVARGQDSTISNALSLVEARAKFQNQWEAFVGNKYLTSQESDMLLKQFERPLDERRQRSFRAGYPLADERAVEGAPMLHIGLTLLKGADKPQVNRLEQQGMIKTNQPNQKDASWRFNTARTLLTDFAVGHDLSFIHTDRTSSIALEARRRRLQSMRPPPNNRLNPTQRATTVTIPTPIGNCDVVTIDSDAVSIVNDLRTSDWDIKATLIEVDEASLIHLMLDFRYLVSHGGPDMTFAETKDVLEKMIEDARRLCIRSPILFRMSTRQHIINSKNTRYGIDHDDKFKTFTTSKGIKEVISLGASYFNSLDSTNSSDQTQQVIRPKFLQMVILLLMLLNDDDLNEIRDFLESTYKLKATRSSLEMAFLKVIPLMSINSQVFLEAMVRAVDNRELFDLNESRPNDMIDATLSCWWDTFIELRVKEGYFLPSGINELGRKERSWSPKWPNEGFKSSQVFDHLQYAKEGCNLRTINEISPIDLHPEAHMQAISVALTDGNIVTIHPSDMDNITLLSPGKYAVTETSPGSNGRIYDLLISEVVINEDIKQSLLDVNSLIDQFNQLLESPRRSRLRQMFTSNPDQLLYIDRLRPAGEITHSVAVGGISDLELASAYKISSRKISRFDVVNIMGRDIQRIWNAVLMIEKRSSEVNGSSFNQERRRLMQKGEAIQTMLTRAETRHKAIMDGKETSDDPISRIIFPSSWNPRDKRIWFDYQAQYTQHDHLMSIEGRAASITNVTWQTGTTAEIMLNAELGSFLVKPLDISDDSEQEDQLRIGDLAVLAGQYMLLGVRSSNSRDGKERYLMENCLQIIAVNAQAKSRRGTDRAQQRDNFVRIDFR